MPETTGPLFVHTNGDAGALPLESMVDPDTGFHHALHLDGVSVVRATATLSDEPVWGASTNVRIAFVDATAEPAHADKHWEAIEACATALGGEARRGSRASPGTLEEVAAWRPSIVHLMAHGAEQGRTDFPGPSVRAS